MSNVPNFLSLLRLLTAPLLSYFILTGRSVEALALSIIAGLSDWFDGWLARLLKAESPAGKYLDPAADKLLLVTSFVSLGITGQIAPWLVVLVLGRDVVIVAGVLLLWRLRGRRNFTPIFIGKISTGFQILAVLATLVLSIYRTETLAKARIVAVAGCAIFTIASGVAYVARGIQMSSRNEK